MVAIRRAAPEDAQGIVDAYGCVWKGETLDTARVAAVLAEPDHVTHVAVDGEVIIGFVDSFLTLSHMGVRRWEVDLLAVRPDYRCQGIAGRLVSRSVEAGREMRAEIARALVRVDNVGAQRVFTRSGFKKDGLICGLYVSEGMENQSVISHSELGTLRAHTIPVHTLTYHGTWLEGNLSYNALVNARPSHRHNTLDISGAVIPHTNTEYTEQAIRAEYHSRGNFHFWKKQLRSAK